MRYRITHVTRYAYGSPVSLCHSITHLKPRETPFQRCISTQVRVTPWPSVAREHRDLFGNRVNYFSIQQAHSTLEVSAVSEVDVTTPLVPPLGESTPWEQVRERLHEDRDPSCIAARIFTLPSPAIPMNDAATDYALSSFTPGRPLLEATGELMSRIFDEFEYDPSSTTIATPLDTVMEHRRGVCQDFAQIAISALRGLGLAARYVSGYIETLPADDQPKLRGADASHAWFAVYLPGLENTGTWVNFDPTNDTLIHEQHITTAVGRDYQDVTPVRGVFYGGGEHQLSVAVDVDRVK
ncbi:MAG: transglutaminase family protein [Thiohalocapsa sp.]|nr:transglutaminase family protein [Thiohalocapsa sp.]MCF7992771.1 transglutaminase family protein [Thiohalocapsa sp.]